MQSDTIRATKKQQALLEFVQQFIGEHDYGPSYREIMKALEYKSVSTVAVHVEALISKGFLSRNDSSARSLSVVKQHSKTVKPSDIIEKIKQYISNTDRSEKDYGDASILITALEILGETGQASSLRTQLEASRNA